jgi:hypothetical protein
MSARSEAQERECEVGSTGVCCVHNAQVALTRDIQMTLASWKDQLNSCDLILTHAPSSNGKVIFGGESPSLNQNDARIRWG